MAVSDLARATAFALNSMPTLRLDRGQGLLWCGQVDAETAPGILATDADLARRVRDELDLVYAEAKSLIARRRGVVLAVANGLVASGSLDAPAIAGLITGAEGVRAP